MKPPSTQTEFDIYAEKYSEILDGSVNFSGFSATHFTERKIREIFSVLQNAGIANSPLRFLNFGCGIGTGEPYITRDFPSAEVYSIDISSKSIELAKQRCLHLPRIHFSAFDGHKIPFQGPFDVVLLAGVLHHIQPSDRMTVLNELYGCLGINGYLFLFEHNPWNPVTRRIVMDCPFDRNAHLISAYEARKLLSSAGFRIDKTGYIFFFPQALSALIPLEHYLSHLPIGAQYYCIARQAESAAQNSLR